MIVAGQYLHKFGVLLALNVKLQLVLTSQLQLRVRQAACYADTPLLC
jgi:hypothetical protein